MSSNSRDRILTRLYAASQPAGSDAAETACLPCTVGQFGTILNEIALIVFPKMPLPGVQILQMH